MGFKIVLRSFSQAFADALYSAFDDSSLEIIRPEGIAWDDIDAVKTYIKMHSACAVVNGSLRDSSEEQVAVANIAAACSERDIPFLHFSSYRVFGAASDQGPLDESRMPEPADDYGRHLLALESKAATVRKHLILRVSWVFGGDVENICATLIPQLLRGAPVYVSDHDFGCPVSLPYVAGVVRALMQQILCGADNWGVFHLRSSDRCSEAEFCDVVVRILSGELGYDVSMPSVAPQGDSRRLLQGSAELSGDRITRNFGIQRASWRKRLKVIVQNYVEGLQAQKA